MSSERVTPFWTILQLVFKMDDIVMQSVLDSYVHDFLIENGYSYIAQDLLKIRGLRNSLDLKGLKLEQLVKFCLNERRKLKLIQENREIYKKLLEKGCFKLAEDFARLQEIGDIETLPKIQDFVRKNEKTSNISNDSSSSSSSSDKGEIEDLKVNKIVYEYLLDKRCYKTAKEFAKLKNVKYTLKVPKLGLIWYKCTDLFQNKKSEKGEVLESESDSDSTEDFEICEIVTKNNVKHKQQKRASENSENLEKCEVLPKKCDQSEQQKSDTETDFFSHDENEVSSDNENGHRRQSHRG